MSSSLLIDYYEKVMEENLNKTAGLLFYDIYLGIRDFLSGGSSAPFALICGHTLTQLSLRSILNISSSYEDKWPTFGTMMAFEVLKAKDSKIMIRILTDGIEKKRFSLEEFSNFAQKMRPDETECQMKYPYVEKDKKSFGIKMLQMAFS